MGDRMFVEPESENNHTGAVRNGDAVQKDPQSPPPSDQLDFRDRTKIDSDIPPATEEKANPQLESDLDNVDKAMAMLSRPKNPELNPVLVAKVTESFVQIIDEAKSSASLPDSVKIKIDATSLRFIDLSKKYKHRVNERLDDILVKKSDKEMEKELNELSSILARLYRTEERLLANADQLGITSKTVSGIKDGIDEGRKLEEKGLAHRLSERLFHAGHRRCRAHGRGGGGGI